MMQGVVNQNCEATISLVLVNESGQRRLIADLVGWVEKRNPTMIII